MALSAFFSIFLFLSSAQADNQEARQKEIRQNLEEKKKLLLETEIKRKGVLGTLSHITRRLNKVSHDIGRVEGEVASSRKTISKIAKQLLDLRRKKSKDGLLLKKRLRALYKLGLGGYAKVLLSSSSGQELARNIRFLQIVIQRNAELLKSYTNSIFQVSKTQRRMKKHVKKFMEKKLVLEKHQRDYSEQKSQQVALLRQINGDRERHLQAIKEWRQAGIQLEKKLVKLGRGKSILSDISRGTFLEYRGKLPRPVSGPVVQGYGYTKNKRFNTQILHKGMFFAAQIGSRVSAMFWGTVVFSGWLNGFGHTIILDHGEHYYSLYSHNSALLRSRGEKVESGDEIALSGDTASLRGPGLYVEIRQFSKSLDPARWLDLNRSKSL